MIRTFDSMDEALIGAVDELLRTGENVSPRGLATRELLSYTFRLSNPRARRVALPARHWHESLAVGEFCWHLAQSDSVDFIAYYAPVWKEFSEDGQRIASSCYGKRIFGAPAPSQWDRAYRALVRDPATRRAVLTLVDMDADLAAAKDVSCITSIQLLVRNGLLDCITTMRSCDVIWGLCYDVYFCTMLQELMATQLGVRLGWYQHFSGSLHLYNHFATMAARIIDDGMVARAELMAPLEAPEVLPSFLAAEAALRYNHADAEVRIEELPPYWRALAAPLQRLHERRWMKSASV